MLPKFSTGALSRPVAACSNRYAVEEWTPLQTRNPPLFITPYPPPFSGHQLVRAEYLADARPPYELILIDIGSLAGTAEYLAGIAAASSIRVKIVRTATDMGIAIAVSNALKQARGGR